MGNLSKAILVLALIAVFLGVAGMPGWRAHSPAGYQAQAHTENLGLSGNISKGSETAPNATANQTGVKPSEEDSKTEEYDKLTVKPEELVEVSTPEGDIKAWAVPCSTPGCSYNLVTEDGLHSDGVYAYSILNGDQKGTTVKYTFQIQHPDQEKLRDLGLEGYSIENVGIQEIYGVDGIYGNDKAIIRINIPEVGSHMWDISKGELVYSGDLLEGDGLGYVYLCNIMYEDYKDNLTKEFIGCIK
ncbi:MAG: hypothetical protein JW727_00215 [Candidatus Aenigmarchaeota archaeon]|nr:hypothetical protein [Candidatus Aenigmarchaeota archaeon]